MSQEPEGFTAKIAQVTHIVNQAFNSSNPQSLYSQTKIIEARSRVENSKYNLLVARARMDKITEANPEFPDQSYPLEALEDLKDYFSSFEVAIEDFLETLEMENLFIEGYDNFVQLLNGSLANISEAFQAIIADYERDLNQ